MLPQSYPNYKTVHRRFQTWCRNEVLRRVLTDFANELRDKGALDEEECFIDATFIMAKGGGAEIGATKRGKGRPARGTKAGRSEPVAGEEAKTTGQYFNNLSQLKLLAPYCGVCFDLAGI